jgi:GST-like protein
MYTLYGFQGSGSAAIEVALEWTGAPFERVDAASWEADSQLEALRRVNPLLQIPTLGLPDGSVLTESAAILIQLGLAHPDSGLLPAAAAARAQAIRGLVYVAANCYAAIGVIDYPERWLATDEGAAVGNATREALRLGTRARLHALWDTFADQFAAGIDAADARFLGGTAPGALDLLSAVVSKWSGARAHLAASRPAFSALLARIEQHPRIAPTFARHWPEAAT